MKIITWILANGATFVGLVQAIVKAIKELVTGIVNLISLFVSKEKASAMVATVRNVLNKIDSVLETVKGKLI